MTVFWRLWIRPNTEPELKIPTVKYSYANIMKNNAMHKNVEKKSRM